MIESYDPASGSLPPRLARAPQLLDHAVIQGVARLLGVEAADRAATAQGQIADAVELTVTGAVKRELTPFT